jgi:hypothetical protein
MLKQNGTTATKVGTKRADEGTLVENENLIQQDMKNYD